MTILIMITGIVGNLLTIVALLKCPKVRNVAAAFIIRLVPILFNISLYSLIIWYNYRLFVAYA